MDRKAQIKFISDLGLSEHEASVYMCMLGLGPTTVLSIARATGIRRTTVYSVLERLKSKGLVSGVTKGFKKLFVAESPEQLQTIADSRRNNLAALMPSLLKTYRAGAQDSEIKTYEGLRAIQALYAAILRNLKAGDTYEVIENLAQWYSLDKEYSDNFIEKRALKGVKARFLFQDSPEARHHMKYAKNFSVEDKILPVGVSLDTSLIVTPHELIIHELGQPSRAILIRNKSAIQMGREIFKLLWTLL